MHKIISELTKITTEDLQHGIPFPEAFDQFQSWAGNDCIFLTWGPNDIDMLQSNMLLHKINTDRLPRSYDVQVIFDSQIAKESRQYSLTYAMEKVGETALEAHDALHDALNTARICLHLDLVKGIAEYPRKEKKTKPRKSQRQHTGHKIAHKRSHSRKKKQAKPTVHGCKQ